MYCLKCGKPRAGAERFCLHCGAAMQAVISQAKLMNQSEFRNQRNLLFWGFLIGIFVHGLLTLATDTPLIISLLNLLELVAFVVAFVRAKHNWLVLWVYFLAASAAGTLIWLAFGGFYTLELIGVGGSLLWFAFVPVLIYWHQQISSQLSLDPWKPTSSNSDW